MKLQSLGGRSWLHPHARLRSLLRSLSFLKNVSAESLALQACDDIDNLQVVRRAYACLKKLIAPQHVNDTEDICATRTEFSILVRLVNEELQRSIEAADTTIQSLRVALSKGRRN